MKISTLVKDLEAIEKVEKAMKHRIVKINLKHVYKLIYQNLSSQDYMQKTNLIKKLEKKLNITQKEMEDMRKFHLLEKNNKIK